METPRDLWVSTEEDSQSLGLFSHKTSSPPGGASHSYHPSSKQKTVGFQCMALVNSSGLVNFFDLSMTYLTPLAQKKTQAARAKAQMGKSTQNKWKGVLQDRKKVKTSKNQC